MDPYAILGIEPEASLEEVKTAFRREASKWHPDKVGDAFQAKQNFQAVNQAYQQLSKQLRHRASYHSGPTDSSELDQFDDVVKAALLDYAVSLARSGMVHEDIEAELYRQGYDRAVAGALTDQALDYRRNFPSTAAENLNTRRFSSVFRKDKIDDRLTQAFLGADYPFTGNRKQRSQINYYQDVFRDFYLAEINGSRFQPSRNRYLWKLLFRSIVMLGLVLAVIFYFPFLKRHIPLGEFDLLQLPNMVLSLMLVWAFYRRLWEFGLLALIVFAGTQMLFYYQMPTALDQGISAVLITEVWLFSAFLLLVFLGNYFYFQKAKSTIEEVCLEKDDIADRCYYTKKKGKPSVALAWTGLFLVGLYFLHMVPQHSSLSGKVEWLVSGQQSTGQSKGILEVKKQISDSSEVFQMAERAYYQEQPDHRHTVRLYEAATRYGSLLAAYKLGYMYLHGMGVPQSDTRARHYFEKAVNMSLSSQPHDLRLTTAWLAESYNGLGIMQLIGRDSSSQGPAALASFRSADKFGSGRGVAIWNKRGSLTRSELVALVMEPHFR